MSVRVIRRDVIELHECFLFLLCHSNSKVSSLPPHTEVKANLNQYIVSFVFEWKCVLIVMSLKVPILLKLCLCIISLCFFFFWQSALSTREACSRYSACTTSAQSTRSRHSARLCTSHSSHRASQQTETRSS